MQPFEEKPIAEPNAFEKLFHKIPKKNFIIELNNLLSEYDLEKFPIEKVKDLTKKYEVEKPEKTFDQDLIEIFTDFLQFHLGNPESRTSDILSAQNFQKIVQLDNNQFTSVYFPLAKKAYAHQVTQILNSRLAYTETEQQIFDEIQNRFGISEKDAEEIINVKRTEIVTNYYKKIIEDRRITPEEEEFGKKLCTDLQVEAKFDENDGRAIKKFRMLWDIEHGELPILLSEILIPKNEYCYMECAATLFENRKVTKSVGYAGPSLRVKIIKGVYFRAGNMGLKMNSEDVLTELGTGILYITNKRILFKGETQNKSIRYNQVIDIETYNDGVGVIKEAGRSPFFKIHDEDSEIVAATIARFIRDS